MRALVRPTSDRNGIPDAVECVEGDVTDATSVARALRGCEAAYHMAAVVKSWTPDASIFERVNVGGLKNVLDAAAAEGIERIIYTSSFIALGPTDGTIADENQTHPRRSYCNDYERTKAIADAIALEAIERGVPLIPLYPGVVYGPGEMTDGNIIVKMVADHLNGRLPGIIGPGDRRWSYVFVDDVLEGHLLALTKGRLGQRYLLCGDNVTNRELFAVVEQITGARPPRLAIPYGVASLMGRAAVAVANLTGRPPLITHEVVDVFRHEWAYSSEKAKTELGYGFRPLSEGLNQTITWMKAENLVG